MNAHASIYWWRLSGAWTGCYVHIFDAGNSKFLARDLCLRFSLPGIGKQCTTPACLLTELFLLCTPCLSESTHLKLKQTLVSEINTNDEIKFDT
jgi:hypothetical protein